LHEAGDALTTVVERDRLQAQVAELAVAEQAGRVAQVAARGVSAAVLPAMNASYGVWLGTRVRSYVAIANAMRPAVMFGEPKAAANSCG
jgi:hypothetical protein